MDYNLTEQEIEQLFPHSNIIIQETSAIVTPQESGVNPSLNFWLPLSVKVNGYGEPISPFYSFKDCGRHTREWLRSALPRDLRHANLEFAFGNLQNRLFRITAPDKAQSMLLSYYWHDSGYHAYTMNQRVQYFNHVYLYDNGKKTEFGYDQYVIRMDRNLRGFAAAFQKYLDARQISQEQAFRIYDQKRWGVQKEFFRLSRTMDREKYRLTLERYYAVLQWWESGMLMSWRFYYDRDGLNSFRNVIRS